jgi:hypothetical protein
MVERIGREEGGLLARGVEYTPPQCQDKKLDSIWWISL